MSDSPGFKAADDLVSKRLGQIHRAWQALAGGGMPPRDAVTPARLRSALASSFIMDVVDGGKDFRFRFAGDRVIQFMGRRYAGSVLSEFRGQPFFDGMYFMYSQCTRLKRPIAIGPLQASLQGKEFLEFEVMAWPLSDDGSAVTALLGGLDSWPLGTHLQRPAPSS